MLVVLLILVLIGMTLLSTLANLGIGVYIMAQLDDLKAQLEAAAAAQAEAAVSQADLANDVDKLLTLIVDGTDLTEAISLATSIAATARAQADASAANAAKFDSTL